jgi:predicted dehydrogenase
VPDGTSAADRIGLGIVGAGTHARKMLIPSLTYVDDLRLVAMSSRSRESADRVEQTHGVKCHVGHEALLADESIDAIVISLPTAMHETVGAAALEAGKHVLIESGYPKLLDAHAVDALRRLQKNKVLMFGNCELYMPIYEKLKELMGRLRARIGLDETLSVSTRYYWWPRYSQGAGIHHFLNLLLWLNGPVRKVWSIGTQRQIQGMLEYANNDIGLFSGAEYDTPYLPMERVEVLGRDSAITATNGYELRYCDEITPAAMGGHYRFDQAHETVWHPSFSLSYTVNTSLYLRGYVPELEDFARCIRTGYQPRTHLDQIAACQRLTHAVLASMRKRGEAVALEQG